MISISLRQLLSRSLSKPETVLQATAENAPAISAGAIDNRAELNGHVGGEVFSAHLGSCGTGDAAFGGTAYSAPYLFVPCNGAGLTGRGCVSAARSPSTSLGGNRWSSIGNSGEPVARSNANK